MSKEEVYAPKHYNEGFPCETIAMIEAVMKDPKMIKLYHIGNALKYLIRINGKDSFDSNLRKAHNYLHRALYGEWFGEDRYKSRIKTHKLPDFKSITKEDTINLAKKVIEEYPDDPLANALLKAGDNAIALKDE